MNRSIGTGFAAQLIRKLLALGSRYWASLVVCVCLLESGCATSSREELADAEAPTPVLLYRQTPRPDELGRLVVPVELNGQGPFYFLLDTGAARSALAQSALERLGMSGDENQQVFIRGVNGRSRVPTVVVDSFRVGDMEFRAHRLPVLRTRLLDGLDGILSMSPLRATHLTADFASAEVRIMNVAEGEAAPNTVPMRFSTLSKALIVVDARVGEHRVPAIIDTGGAHTLGNVALLNKLIADAGGVLNGVIPAHVTDATDTAQETWDSRVETLSLGSVAIDDLRISFGRFPIFKLWQLDNKPALLIGMDVLSQMKSLSVDYRRREVGLAAREGD